jgi:hypothetical protein
MACGEAGKIRDLAARLGVETRQRSAGRVVATYDYRDEAGTLLYQVLRYDKPKSFRQRRPDGAVGWRWDVKDARRVLYRLPELLSADPDQALCR